jgi:nicotinamidase-related amidase
VDPEHTALLVIDPQNDLCLKEGAIGKMGYDRSIYDFTVYPPVLERLKPLLDSARASNVTVVYTQAIRLRDPPTTAADTRMALKIYRQTDPKRLPKSVVEGSWGAGFVEGLKPLASDIVIRKTRNSAFFGTSLDMLLRRRHIQTVIVTGCQTDGCVESTVRDASYSLGYVTVIVSDCVASFCPETHDAMIKVFERRYDVVTSKQLIDAWQNS